jgi:predicted GTPase
MLEAKVPVVSVCAVRTGSGKSQTTAKISDILTKKGYRVVIVRHPIAYRARLKRLDHPILKNCYPKNFNKFKHI